MPVLPSLCSGKGEKDCECAERFPTETASSASWGTYIQQKNRGTKSMFTGVGVVVLKSFLAGFLGYCMV